MTGTKSNHRTDTVPDTACPDRCASLARHPDLPADFEPQRGRHDSAEYLARQPAEMRAAAESGALAYPGKGPRPLIVVEQEISQFVAAIFPYADDNTYVSLRAFDQHDRDKHIVGTVATSRHAGCQLLTNIQPEKPGLGQRARYLDRLADAELQHSHTGLAEYLARQATALREGVRQ